MDNSCFPTEFIRIENRERSTPPSSRVASAKRIAADMVHSMTANTFLSCFFKMHRQKNSAQFFFCKVLDSRLVKTTNHLYIFACVCVQCLCIHIAYVHHNPPQIKQNRIYLRIQSMQKHVIFYGVHIGNLIARPSMKLI